MDLRCTFSPSLGIMITGSTGFIGQRLVESFDLQDFQVMDIEAVPEGTKLIHLAADVTPSPEAMLSNIACDALLIKLADKLESIIYASTNNVYPYALNCQIQDSTRCNDFYSASKITGEKLLSDLTDIPVVVVRFPDVFGLGQRHGNFFKAIENAIQLEKPLVRFGKGLKRRTFIHVDELCRTLKYLSSSSVDRKQFITPINLGYSDSASIVEIIEEVSSQTGLKVEVKEVKNDKSELDIRTLLPSPVPGYRSKWNSFREALTSYVCEVQQHKG